MSEFRLISSIVLLYVMLMMEFPIPTMVTTAVIFVAYLIIKNAPNFDALNLGNMNNSVNRTSRLKALERAAMYLAPYSNIWHDLRLTNKHCNVKLNHYGNKITVEEKIVGSSVSGKKFRICYSDKYNMQEIFNDICTSFDYATNYYSLKESCKIIFDADIYEYETEFSASNTNIASYNTTKSQNNSIKVENVQKVDVNNASEIELTALPGISIVLSKRIIKKREEIKGFKNLNEFFLFVQLKSHMEEQLRTLVCVNPMKGSLKIERFKERKLDL